jgi:hypothetical protein
MRAFVVRGSVQEENRRDRAIDACVGIGCRNRALRRSNRNQGASDAV